MNGTRHAVVLWSGALIILFFALIDSGCSDRCENPVGGNGSNNASWETVRSSLDRNTDPAATSAEMEELIRGNHEFALDLYAALGGENGNLLLSPLSIRTAFAMVYGGARCETETEMRDVLHYLSDQDRLHNAFNRLDLELADRNDPGNGGDEAPIEIHIANAFWGEKGYPYESDYLDLLALHYGAGIESIDLNATPEDARQLINGWVEDHTANRIHELLPPGWPPSLPLVAVLTNALYFKAPWEEPFDEGLTSDGVFHLLDSGTVTVPMMRRDEMYGYAEGEDYEALELYYRGGELSMVLLLPDVGAFDSFSDALDADVLDAILDGMEPAGLSVAMPKFSFESEFTLKDPLVELGMVVPFNPGADFTGITAGGGIWIDEAYHKTFIAVDEKGTEAAAATAVVLVEYGAGDSFVVDRPFLFLIRDRVTGAILFFGRMTDPS